jgi:hypothetical protein
MIKEFNSLASLISPGNFNVWDKTTNISKTYKIVFFSIIGVIL